MARVFLLNPPSPEPVRTPLLSFCHLASALQQRRMKYPELVGVPAAGAR